jgi:hypothetical protein
MDNPTPRYTIYQRSAVPTERYFIGDKPDTSYFGDRLTSKGELKQDYVVMRALSPLYYEGPFPIYTYIDKTNNFNSTENIYLPMHLINNADKDGLNNFSYVTPEIQGNDKVKLIFNEEIKNAVKKKEKVLIILVVTPYHAILYIIHLGKLYTVGFGYYGPEEEKILVNRLRNYNQNAIAHAIESRDGALYSPDMVAPLEDHAGKIVWIDYLNMDMINRIEYDLNVARTIIFEGTIQKTKYKLSKYTIISLERRYCEAADFICRDGAQNCIIWAKNILGVKLKCGLKGDPYSCKEVSPTDFEEFIEAYDNTIRTNDDTIVDEVITKIKKHLTRGVCDSVSSCAISGGKTIRRRKNRQSKTKRRKIMNKRRKYKK